LVLKNGIVALSIPFPAKKVPRALALRELAVLEAAYPDAVTALDYASPFTLLIAVILSAQCTDARVNLTTPHLFAAYPTRRRWPPPAKPTSSVSSNRAASSG
jgi:endonuclease III